MPARDGQPSAWTAALSRIEQHQQSVIYMPVAVWAALDMLDDGLAADGRFSFPELEARFASLLQRAGIAGSERAWEPFFHLSRAALIWDLFRADLPADVASLPGGRPKRRGQLVRVADSAQMRSPLLAEVATVEGRQRVREELVARLLLTDKGEAAIRLVNELQGSRLILCRNSDEIERSLSAFNREAAIHEERARHILRTTEYWVWDPSSDSFGPGKFVGYRRMSFPVYERGLAGAAPGAKFDGHLTQVAIRRALRTDFGPSESLSVRLKRWAERLLGAGVLEGLTESKWQFARLPSRRSYWGFLANPARYRIEDAARELDTDTWTVPQGNLDVGDRIAFWRTSGADGRRGIVALAEVLSPPSIRTKTDESLRYWRTPPENVAQRRIVLRYVRPPKAPLWLTPESQPVLSPLSVSRGQGTKAFRIEPEDWWRLVDALGGWPEDEDAEEAVASEHEHARSRGRGSRQGRQMSPQARNAIEDHAMQCATLHFKSLGYEVKDTSKGNPYDLQCTKGKETLYVEVKGTLSLGEAVLLTAGEVRFARANADQMVLFVLHSIDLFPEPDGNVRASGGVPKLEQPWRLADEKLKTITYEYRTCPPLLSEAGSSR